MSKPLTSSPSAAIDAHEFHQRVFAKHGKLCHFRGVHRVQRSQFEPELVRRSPEERCLGDATDAMHIIARSRISAKHLRYAFPEINGRPGCRPCHKLQGDGRIFFSIADDDAACGALDSISKLKLARRPR